MNSHILIKLAIFGFVLMSVAGDVSHLGIYSLKDLLVQKVTIKSKL